MLKIRPIQNHELNQITQIEFESFTDPYPKDLFQFLAKKSPELFLVAVEEGKEEKEILGYAVADIERHVPYLNGHILSIAVGKQYRRRGIGNQLLSELIRLFKSKECNSIVLEVRESNLKAKALYQNLGFIEVKRRSRYYEDGEDAIVMTLDLEDAL
ncbi:MAG: ribosomal protein S18-alanine N-acetyltransferase [Promethearchaeota archaeon]